MKLHRPAHLAVLGPPAAAGRGPGHGSVGETSQPPLGGKKPSPSSNAPRPAAPRIRRAARRGRGRVRSVSNRGDHSVSAGKNRAPLHRGRLKLHRLSARWGIRLGRLPRAARPSRPRRDNAAHQGESRRRHYPHAAAAGARGPSRPSGLHRCSMAPSRRTAARWGIRPRKLPRAARPGRPRRTGRHLAALARGPPPRADMAKGRTSAPRVVFFVIKVDDQNLRQNFSRRGNRPGRPPHAARHSLRR